VTTVQVGTQVSGTISWLGADFNSTVRKGQVIAKLDPSLFEAQVAQAQANLAKANADVERESVNLVDAQRKLVRANELGARQLLPKTDIEAADVAVQNAQAQLRSVRAQVQQAQASLNQSQVNLQHSIIAAPIDGIVIQRSVDVGQTVAASLQSPTVFAIAADMTKMQVNANVDESDIGRIRPGQTVMLTGVNREGLCDVSPGLPEWRPPRIDASHRRADAPADADQSDRRSDRAAAAVGRSGSCAAVSNRSRQGQVRLRLSDRNRPRGERAAQRRQSQLGRYLQHTFLDRSAASDRSGRPDADAAVLR
jgi:RND family efflux transporter MFP subunit